MFCPVFHRTPTISGSLRALRARSTAVKSLVLVRDQGHELESLTRCASEEVVAMNSSLTLRASRQPTIKLDDALESKLRQRRVEAAQGLLHIVPCHGRAKAVVAGGAAIVVKIDPVFDGGLD